MSVSLKKWISKITKRIPIVYTVTSQTFSIAANSGLDIIVDLTKAGFTPIGVIGHEYLGTGSSYLAAYRVAVSNNHVALGIRNYHSTARTGMSVKLWVLYVGGYSVAFPRRLRHCRKAVA